MSLTSKFIIESETWQEVDRLLIILGYPCVSSDEENRINLLCLDNYNNLSTDCQTIYITTLVLKYRGIDCDIKNINYLQDLSNCNSCGLDIGNIITTESNTIFMLGGRTKRRGCCD